MSKHSLLLILPILALALTGCSSEKPQFGLSDTQKTALSELRPNKPAPPASNPFANLRRSELQGLQGPLLVAHLEMTNAYSSLAPIGSNRGVTTFASPDGISVALKQSILVSTRGLPGDLTGAEVDPVVTSFRPYSHKHYRRSLNWTTGENHAETVEFVCSVESLGTAVIEIVDRRFSTRHFRESCQSASKEFENEYWIGLSDGIFWLSRQWVGASIGYINLTTLIP